MYGGNAALMHLTAVSSIPQTKAARCKSEPNSAGRVAVGDKMYCQIWGRGESLLMIMGLGGRCLDRGGVLPKKLADRYHHLDRIAFADSYSSLVILLALRISSNNLSGAT